MEPQKQDPRRKEVDVDEIEEFVKDKSPDDLKAHLKKADVHNADAVLSVSKRDYVVWLSKNWFKVLSIEEFFPGNRPDRQSSSSASDDPFETPITGRSCETNEGSCLLDSGILKNDLFGDTGEEKSRVRFYKIVFERKDGKRIDPHLAVHP